MKREKSRLAIAASKTSYASPIIAVHTYHLSTKAMNMQVGKAKFNPKKTKLSDIKSGVVDDDRTVSGDETVIFIPVEDILHIYYKCEFYKRSKRTPDFSQVSQVNCCSCFGKSEDQTPIIEDRYAERVVQVHMTYAKYSNVHTISNFRDPNKNLSSEFYRNTVEPVENLTFYLANNQIYEEEYFEKVKTEADALCHFVIQSKGLIARAMQQNNAKKEGSQANQELVALHGPQDMAALIQPPNFLLIGKKYDESYMPSVYHRQHHEALGVVYKKNSKGDLEVAHVVQDDAFSNF